MEMPPEPPAAHSPADHSPAELDPADIALDFDDPYWPYPGMLDACEAGPYLAALLNQVRLREAPTGLMVEVAAAAARLASWAASVELAATSELINRVSDWRGVAEPADPTTSDPDHVSSDLMAATEIGAALNLSPQSARNRIQLARSLRRLPGTRRALAEGRIDLVKTRDLVAAVAVLDDTDARAVEDRVLTRAGGQTAAMLRAAMRRAVISIDPTSAQQRHEVAVDSRAVYREMLDDGMSRLEYVDASEHVEAVYLWLTGKAKAAKAPGDPRDLDQRRADVLADLGRHGLAHDHLPNRHGRRPQIGVVVAATTLLGQDDEPGELVGVGPVTAQVARRIAGDGTWRRILTDPRSGRFDELSAESYEPPQDMRDHVIARDRTCRGLGCRMPADLCDLDHRDPHPAGPTSAANLDASCRPWHRVKTHTDTAVKSDGAGGLVITLPSGRRYSRPADPVLDQLCLAGPGPPREDDTPPF
ncbi:MAG: DUF222 domain-containing protein [Sporichthyaceae bacterium]|nr:DUF222 domain-containing protein [Sporichthyaceae bacterium]